MTPWTAADLPDQTGRTVVVTGANSGLGLAATRELAGHGAHVVMACRDEAKAAAARAGLPGSTEIRRLDLADLGSVRAFATALDGVRVDVLVNNAGIMNVPLSRTPEGFESQLATNLLGHFLLTNLLLPQLTDRVVTVSSGAHRIGSIVLDDLHFERRRYNSWLAYGQSKLGDLMFAYELQRRLTGVGSRLRSMAAHPGYAATNLQSSSRGWQRATLEWWNKVPRLAQTPEMGALPILYAATVPDLPGGSYVGPGGFAEVRGYPRTVGSSAASHDRDVASRLWAACEEMTGQPFIVPGSDGPGPDGPGTGDPRPAVAG